MEFLFILVLFAGAMFAMSIGVILSGRELGGSCGGAAEIEGVECGACSKKESDLCPTDSDLVRIAQLGHPNPSHHR